MYVVVTIQVVCAENRMAIESRAALSGTVAPGMTAASAAMRTVLIVAGTKEAGFLTRDKLRKFGVENPIDIYPGVDELLSYWKRQGDLIRDSTRLRPALILIDLSNSHDSTFRLLRWFHRHIGDLGIPIAILTSRESLDQVRRAYQLGVWTFLRMPLGPSEFKAMTDAFKMPIVYSLKTEWPRTENSVGRDFGFDLKKKHGEHGD